MISRLEILIMLIATVLIIHIWFWLTEWSLSIDKNNLYIKYKDFKKSYDINPKQWILLDDNVHFHKEEYVGFQFFTKSAIFQFYPIGYYRYRFWSKNLDKREHKIAQRKAYQEVMSIIKSDIQKGDQK